MNKRQLPSRPNLDIYRELAKDLVKIWRSNKPGVILWEGQEIPVSRSAIASFHPRLAKLKPEELEVHKFTLADAQFIIARQYGFESWPKFAKHVEENNPEDTPYRAFIVAASCPMHGMHVDGTLDEAITILAEHPDLAQRDIFTAAILGDDQMIASILKRNPKLAKRKGGPYKWDPLTYLCFSRYLRLDASRSEGFTRAAQVLLEAGANPNSGFWERNHQPQPEWESVMYGAAGLAHHPGVTKLLLDFGADPNDNETPYHVPESYDNGSVKVLLDSGKLNQDSLTTILLRKNDWHDYDGVKLLLESGADPNRMTMWDHSAFQHAIRRDNDMSIIDLMLDHGADPTLRNRADGRTAIMMAARRGRKDVLESFAKRGFSTDLEGIEGLVIACALDSAEKLKHAESSDVKVLVAQGGSLLAEFAANGNVKGMQNLLMLGVPVEARYSGDGYFGIPPLSHALHVAAWKGHSEAVKALIEAGSDINAIDGRSCTPLILAVRACVDSYWTRRRTPESVRALLEAGARVAGVKYPCGYDEVDELLAPKFN